MCLLILSQSKAKVTNHPQFVITLESGLDVNVPDLGHGMVVDGGADLDVLGEGHRAKVRVVQAGVQPGGQKVKVGQCRAHPDHLYRMRPPFSGSENGYLL